MSRTEALIAAHFDEWGYVPHVVRELFADPSPRGVAAALDEFCRRELGAGVAEPEFFDASVGSVHGLRLDDGRRVVVKVHGPRVTVRFLEAVQAVRRRLADRGFPAPQPLAGPVPLGRGTAVAESLLDDGELVDGHDPAVRRAMAAGLAELVRLCRPLTGLDGLRENMMALEEGRLWPTPHDDRFDFEATTPGAEWIDRIAADARPLRDGGAGDEVVGHTDWRVQHMRFDGGSLSAVYDWDSLTILREPVLVGSVAHAFTANWEAGQDWRQFPALDEAISFVEEYQDARGAHFDAQERAAALAALVYTMAYTARCEHSDALTDMGLRAPDRSSAEEAPAGSARAFLRRHAAALLDQARGASA